MKIWRLAIHTVGILGGFCVQAFSQNEMIERLPEDAYVVDWEPVYRNRIVSYVQLPGDSLEYRKVKVYVVYKPKTDVAKNEEPVKYQDLIRLRYLGAVLIATGRKFSQLLDNSVLGVENTNLTTQDQLVNNEMITAWK